jgi:hypothetical protein
MVNETPLEPYAMASLCAVKLSDAPWVKSIVTDLPSAESAGQPPLVSGSQLLYDCALDSDAMVKPQAKILCNRAICRLLKLSTSQRLLD